MRKLIICIVTVIAAFACPAALYDHIDAQYTATPIVIDGELDPAWNQALPYNLGTCDGYINNLIVEHYLTTARLLWDDKYLYVIFVCDDHDIISRMTQRDQPVYQDDCCEVFLRLDNKNMVEIVISPDNVVYDAKSFRDDNNRMKIDTTFNVEELKTATRIITIDKDHLVWRVEMAIPWTVLGMEPGKQECLNGNILRYESITPEPLKKLNGELKAYLPLSVFSTYVPGWPSGSSSHGKIFLRR